MALQGAFPARRQRLEVASVSAKRGLCEAQCNAMLGRTHTFIPFLDSIGVLEKRG